MCQQLLFVILIGAVLTGLLGCEKQQQPTVIPLSSEQLSTVVKQPERIKPVAYKDIADLPDLRKHVVIRLLAPRFDTLQELPRHGLPMQEYQALAERFVKSLGLEPQWVFVDSFDQLISDLNAGRGDLIITNLSVTPQREKEVAFSIALAAINEVLITHKDSMVGSLQALAGKTITVVQGTAYQDTLLKLQTKYPDFNIAVQPGDTSDTQLLQQIESKVISATIFDGDVADLLLPQYPALVKGPVLEKHRKIAWAVRKNNTQLQRLLNEFLVAEHIQSARNQFKHRDWEQIIADKKLRVLTLNNPASYFIWRGELMGFDYDLIKKFCQENKLRLEVVVKDDIDGLLSALQQGEGDIIAASLTVTDERKARGIVFSRYYMKIREQLISLKGTAPVTAIEQLQGKRIGVNPQTVFFERLQALQNQGIGLHIITKPGVSTETLIAGLAEGGYDFTIADSHLAAIEQSYHDDLQINLNMTDDVDIAWGLRPDQPVLKDKLNTFIKKHYRGLFYNVTFNKYFASSKNIQRHKKFRVTADGQLSPFDEKVKQHTKQYTVDWRLVTAQMYQESKFNPSAKSFAGAQGLMQVMPRTGRQFGYDNLYEPDNAIGAGLAYMHWLHDRFPESMALDERLYFVLAAYNAGAGHVRDARNLARQLGKDPNRWFDNVEEAMLLLSDPIYAKKARFGYVRGSEPVNYVRSIRDRYLAYLRAGSQ